MILKANKFFWEAKFSEFFKGKQRYNEFIIGVDPGEAFGLAVLADGAIVDAENCFSVKETLNKIKSVLRTVDPSESVVTIKIGKGVPIYKELLEILYDALPRNVSLEIVGEEGTNRNGNNGKRGRELKHIVSAACIAGREGYVYSRRTNNENNS